MEHELLTLTRRLLDAIATQDWATYEELCDPSLTCFEPEARGQLVEGLAFHRFYFDQAARGHFQSTLCSPRVIELGPDAGVVVYTRVKQSDSGESAFEETRVWKRVAERWKHVHFHRSAIA